MGDLSELALHPIDGHADAVGNRTAKTEELSGAKPRSGVRSNSLLGGARRRPRVATESAPVGSTRL